ncbi:hypothetical protein AVEN_169089-1 [Araneus ventricosus]|uniref:Uncharacterized protein n=1 Tax=Araneus ventricosus TaxID=182803 RepID=A0A4Y2MJA9_ARAVE|nr:hypothetical protein AVEN_169089-1 [Araneus ventricosus]
MVSAIFMQNGVSPHFANPVKLLLSMHFGSDRIISPHFPTNRAPRSPDLIPCDFWLWSYPKHFVFSSPIAKLAELKTRTAQQIHNIHTDILRSVVERDFSRFELVAENGGQHTEHILSKYCKN